MITVGDSVKDGWETDPTCKWYTLCEDHGSILFYDTIKTARNWAAVPAEWCGQCAEMLPKVTAYRLKHGR